MATKKLYQDILRDHYLHPRNRGELAAYQYASGALNPSCGDTISMQCAVENDVITQVAFTGSGCMISQAAASLWTEYLIGKSLEDVRALTIQDVTNILDIELGPYRARCAFLLIEALQTALLHQS